MPSLERLKALSRDTGFRETTLEKLLRLGEILADIGRHPLLSNVLVLKGGTALNLCFGAPSRLSVDLDFNYVGSLDRSEMERARPQVEGALSTIVRAHGYGPQWSREAHAGRKCFLRYRSAEGISDRIEVDLNFLHRQVLLPVESRRVWIPDGDDGVEVSVLSVPELCAGKICAMLDRMTPRDLYDVVRLPEMAGDTWRAPTTRAIVIALSGTLPHPIHHYGLDRRGKVTQQRVTEQLHPMLIRGHQPTAVELTEAAWAAVRPFIVLSTAEREYVDRLQSGDFRPEPLFPEDSELAGRVREHPALLWKMKNAAEHARRQSRPPSAGSKRTPL